MSHAVNQSQLLQITWVRSKQNWLDCLKAKVLKNIVFVSEAFNAR